MTKRTVLGLLAAIFAASASLFAVVSSNARAATPASGTMTPNSSPATWQGFGAVAAAPQGEASCTEGSNCDTFTLTLAPGDYTGRRIRFKITWSNQFNDYDLYIHAGTVAGPILASSTAGIPETSEEATVDINRVVTAGVNDTFAVRTVYFQIVTSDPYHGSAALETIPSTPPRVASYVPGSKIGLSFSRSRTTYAHGAQRDLEPSARVDFQGNAYAGAIRGLSGGDDLWRFDLNSDPFLRAASASLDINGFIINPAYKGMPDAISPVPQDQAGGDGGGDMDLAVGFKLSTVLGASTVPPLALTSLLAANISSQRSFDRADSYSRNPAGNVSVPIDDRNWMEFYGGNSVYLAYREFTGLIATSKFYVNRSDDAGYSYGPAVLASVGGNTTGNITVDQRDGTVYFCFQGGGLQSHANDLRVAIGKPPLPGLPPTEANYHTVTAASGQSATIAALFPVCKAAPDGTLYVAYSDGGTAIFLAHSLDHGDTWSQPVRVSNLASPSTSIFPWLTTGKKPGSVALAWYGVAASDSDDGQGQNNNAANWKVFFAQSVNATDFNPTFYQTVASDHYIHGSNVSLGGFGGTANRNLGDFFQLEVDPRGLAFIAYDDDHNDYSGDTFVTHQVGGLSLTTGAQTTISGTDRVPAPNPALPQVLDERHDARVSAAVLPQVPDEDTPVDILSVAYGCDPAAPGLITAIMRLSGLIAVPPQAIWRMSFASNPTRPFVSDHADQWFVQASTDPTATPSFSYGKAQRNSDGSLSYATLGTADFGAIDTVNRQIVLKVAVAKLNAAQIRGVIGAGTTFIGLRGSASIASTSVAGLVGVGLSDVTRGGTSYTYNPATCASTPTSGGGGGGQGDDGEGEDGDGSDRDSFRFHDDSRHPETSDVQFSSPSWNFTMQSVGGARSVTYSNGTCVNLTGNALVNTAPGYTYAFTACDLLAVGQIGNFTMAVSGPGGFVYQKAAAITSGFLSIHPQ